jgi:hypothetical protein
MDWLWAVADLVAAWEAEAEGEKSGVAGGRIPLMANPATETDLEAAILEFWKEERLLGFPAGYLYQMFIPGCENYIGGIKTLKKIIRNAPTAGFEFVKKHNRLDLALEHLVLEERFAHLFTDEDRDIAKFTLEQFSK